MVIYEPRKYLPYYRFERDEETQPQRLLTTLEANPVMIAPPGDFSYKGKEPTVQNMRDDISYYTEARELLFVFSI
jgi:hypothetical protein